MGTHWRDEPGLKTAARAPGEASVAANVTFFWFAAAIGLMFGLEVFIAPALFGGPAYVPIRALLGLLGAAATAGGILLALAALGTVRGPLVIVGALLSATVDLALALDLLVTGVVSGLVGLGLYGAIIAYAGLRLAAGRALPRELFLRTVAANQVLIGATMVAWSEQYRNPALYAGFGSYLWLFAPTFVLAGAGIWVALDRGEASRLRAFAFLAAFNATALVYPFGETRVWTGVSNFAVLGLMLLLGYTAPRRRALGGALVATLAIGVALWDLSTWIGADLSVLSPPGWTALRPVVAFTLVCAASSFVLVALRLAALRRLGIVLGCVAIVFAGAGFVATVDAVGLAGPGGASLAGVAGELGAYANGAGIYLLLGAAAAVTLAMALRPSARWVDHLMLVVATAILSQAVLNLLGLVMGSPLLLESYGLFGFRLHAAVAFLALAAGMLHVAYRRILGRSLGERVFASIAALLVIGAAHTLASNGAASLLVRLGGTDPSAVALADAAQAARNTTFVLLVAAALLVGLVITRTVTMPIGGILVTIDRYARGDRAARVAGVGHDEIGDIGRAFNGMADRLGEAEAQLRHLALHEPLTDLPNRTLLRDRFEQALAGVTRRASRCALAIVDLDNFKRVNDTYGHPAGDLLLRGVAQRFRQVTRAGDTIARFGGDEFAVVLADVASTESARDSLLRITAALDPTLDVDGHPVRISATTGWVVAPDQGASFDELLRRADIALAAAKHAHVHEMQYAEGLARPTAEALSLESELPRALERDELLLHYQPIVELASGRPLHLEALVRWEHPVLGLLPPSRFVPLAEETGLTRALGRWVLERALREGLDLGGGVLGVAVNLSLDHFRDPALAPSITELLHSLRRDPRLLTVEITESALLLQPSEVLENLAALRRAGVRVSIDDFGAGYSSFAYLQQLPIDELKLDMVFVDAAPSDPRSRAIVRAALDLAHRLEVPLVAEGIERQASLDLLREIGCEQGQGYIFCRPQPAREMRAWLADWMAVARPAPVAAP